MPNLRGGARLKNLDEFNQRKIQSRPDLIQSVTAPSENAAPQVAVVKPLQNSGSSSNAGAPLESDKENVANNAKVKSASPPGQILPPHPHPPPTTPPNKQKKPPPPPAYTADYLGASKSGPLERSVSLERDLQAYNDYQMSVHDEQRAAESKMAALGLQIRPILGDGNCLFRALSDQLEGGEDAHHKYREQVAQYIQANNDYFSKFLEADFAVRLQETSVFAGQESLAAFANLYDVVICIHHLEHPITTIRPFNLSSESSKSNDKTSDDATAATVGASTEKVEKLKSHDEKNPQRVLHILFHTKMQHYSSLRVQGDVSSAPTHFTTLDKSLMMN